MAKIHRSRSRIGGKRYTAEQVKKGEYFRDLEKAILEQISLGVTSPDIIGTQLQKSGDQIRRYIKRYADEGKVELTPTGPVKQKSVLGTESVPSVVQGRSGDIDSYELNRALTGIRNHLRAAEGMIQTMLEALARK